MPKAVHDKLERQAVKRHLKGARKAAYIYGTLRRIEQREKQVKKGKKKDYKKAITDKLTQMASKSYK